MGIAKIKIKKNKWHEFLHIITKITPHTVCQNYKKSSLSDHLLQVDLFHC